MTAIEWDKSGEHTYETGVDHGVLYIFDNGSYKTGIPWNGLTTVTESPSGAEASAQYADNIKYLNLYSNEEWSGTIEAFTYPDEFAQCDGSMELGTGIYAHQQNRKTFGLVYRSKIGNDTEGDSKGYKIHILYGLYASPSERKYKTVNDSPEAISFSWSVSSTPVQIHKDGFKPTSSVEINSLLVKSAELKKLEEKLFGNLSNEPTIQLPDQISSMISSTVTTGSSQSQ